MRRRLSCYALTSPSKCLRLFALVGIALSSCAPVYCLEAEPSESQSRDRIVRYRLKTAKTLLAEDKPAEAIVILNRALALDPKSLDVRVRLADALYMQGNYSAALLECNKALARAPQNAELLHRRATIYSALKLHAQALKDINSAITLKPDKYGYLLAKAAIAQAGGEHEAAIAALHRYLNNLKPDGEGKKRCYMMILKCTAQLQNPAREKAEFTEFIANYPQLSRGYEYRGYSYLRQEKFALAVSDLQKALEIDPQNNHVRKTLQRALAQKNRKAFSD